MKTRFQIAYLKRCLNAKVIRLTYMYNKRTEYVSIGMNVSKTNVLKTYFCRLLYTILKRFGKTFQSYVSKTYHGSFSYALHIHNIRFKYVLKTHLCRLFNTILKRFGKTFSIYVLDTFHGGFSYVLHIHNIRFENAFV